MRSIHARRALLDTRWADDLVIDIEHGIISGIRTGRQAVSRADLHAELLVPGLIDNHNHGGYGCNAMTSGPEQFAGWLEDLQGNGTTSVMATLYTAPLPVMKAGLAVIARVAAMQREGSVTGARILGVHAEGPYINPRKPGAGAMDINAAALPSISHFDEMVAGHEPLVRELTLAPEMDPDFRLLSHLRSLGIRVLAGHTNASYEEAVSAFSHGAGAVCHFFNASAGIHHRAPGILTAALLDPAIYCEAICDFAHVHPAALRLLLAMKTRERLMIISDSVTMTGLPDCTYMDGEDRVIQKDGVNRLESGDLAGGAAYVLDGVKKLVSIGVPLEDALIMGSRTPAAWLGRDDVGSLRIGGKADLLALDDALDVVFSLVGGQAGGPGI
jgi:N-acetylglucosamine-6-phosphate deacetylase